MDKWIGCNLKNHLEVDKWHERTSSLDPNLDPTGLGGKKRERERRRKKEREFKERGPTFSLDFPAIGPSNSGNTRGKVDLHCKSYSWVLVFWSYGNSGR